MPRMPSAGKDPQPPVPEVDRAKTSSVVVPTSASVPLHHQVLVVANCGALIRHGALAGTCTVLDRFREDLGDTDICLARERIVLATALL